MNTKNDFPQEIHFTNVQDELVTHQVVYEWKPILRNTCKKLSHNEQECKSGTSKEKALKQDKRPRKDKDGFQLVVRKQYVVKQKSTPQKLQGVEVTRIEDNPT